MCLARVCGVAEATPRIPRDPGVSLGRPAVCRALEGGQGRENFLGPNYNNTQTLFR